MKRPKFLDSAGADVMRIVLAIALLALVAAIPLGAQADDTASDPAQAIRWSWHLEPATAPPGSEAELVVLADLAPHWVLYSSDFQAELGPQPTRIKRAAKSSLEFLEPLRSVGAKRKRDAGLNVEYGYFAGHAELRQRVRLPADGSPVEATLNGQACYEADGTCHLVRQPITVASR